ncbi:hypothetical protein F0L17_26555 [Streptomyces sp. TRM43335]|uniref:Ricin B lectin domain-containing protein n=1 Tax=Streptomyces taklimakanensis TaxID=2569853 RepID=A0A6G2BL13_9ACTN|nr:ricin-type beta-trefoil lectin domain protein [Streptomyces taklimakanensis]MTE22592.1 hypothetical protein [Streptomyces taklimakanensis]
MLGNKKATVIFGAAALALAGLMGPAGHANADPWEPNGQEFRAYNVSVEQYLDSDGSGDNVITYPPVGSNHQVWVEKNPSGNTFQLTTLARPTECAKAPTTLGKPITMVECADVPTQRWEFVREGDRFIIQRANSDGEVMAATGKSSPGNLKNVVLQSRTGSLAQRWYVNPID